MTIEWESLKFEAYEEMSSISTGLSAGLGTLLSIMEVATTTLDILSTFLESETNPLSGIFQALLAEIEILLENLKESGIYALFMVPQSWEELVDYKGGYGKFEQTFVNSFYDIADPNRPQIPSSGVQGGLIILLSAPNPSDFLQRVLQLLEFFDRPIDLHYPSPVNVQARLATELGIPVEDAFWAWDKEKAVSTIRLEWQEPRAANDVLLDIFARNKFYIERSKTILGVQKMVKVEDELRRTPLDKRAGEPVYEPATDSEGNPLFYWEPALDPSSPFVEFGDTRELEQNRLNFLAGSYAYILRGIQKGTEHGYYYRVRSVPTETTLEKKEAQVLDHRTGQIKEKASIYELCLGGEEITHLVPPSSAVFGVIPDVDPDFDLPTALLQVYRVAYLLRMDERLQEGGTGKELLGSGVLEDRLSDSVFSSGSEGFWDVKVYEDQETFYFTEPLLGGETGEGTFKEAEAFLEKDLVENPFNFDPFGGADEFMGPRLSFSVRENLRAEIDQKALDMIRQNVSRMEANDSLRQTFQNAFANYQDMIDEVLRESGITERDFKGQTRVRSEIYELLQIASTKPSGQPPNWVAVKLLEDLFPAVHDVMDHLHGSIASLSRLAESSLEELQASITAVRDRIDVLTAILTQVEVLIGVLDAFANLSVGFHVLGVPPEEGGTPKFIENFRTAQSKPAIPYDDYVGAVVMSFGGEGGETIKAISNLFKFLFGK